MAENELIQPEAEEVFMPPEDVSSLTSEQEETVEVEASDVEEETPVEAEAEEEETPEEPEPEPKKEAKVDEAPEVDPDSPLGKALAQLEKMDKRLGYEQRQREKLEKQITRPPTPEPKEDVAAPKQDDFETYEEYQEAVIDYKVEKGIQDYATRVSESSRIGSLEGFIEETKGAGREMYSDFDEVVLTETVPLTKPMLEIMQECENPESVAYYLGKNVKDCQAISRMSPIQAARAMGKIESIVQAELRGNPTGSPAPAVKAKKISSAPPPVKPLGSGNIVSKDPEKMSQEEYEAWRAKGGGR